MRPRARKPDDVDELERVSRDLEKLSERVQTLYTDGSELTRVRFNGIIEQITDVKSDINGLEADVKTLVNSKANVGDLDTMRKAQATSRSAVYAALVAAALSLAGSLILFAVVKASGG
jgi:hypothetical protein